MCKLYILYTRKCRPTAQSLGPRNIPISPADFIPHECRSSELADLSDRASSVNFRSKHTRRALFLDQQASGVGRRERLPRSHIGTNRPTTIAWLEPSTTSRTANERTTNRRPTTNVRQSHSRPWIHLRAVTFAPQKPPCMKAGDSPTNRLRTIVG